MSAGSRPSLVVIGANHRSAGLSLRDLLFVDDRTAPGFLAGLARAGLAQALVLSTCDRVEVWAFHVDAVHARHLVAAALAVPAGLETGTLASQLYLHQDRAALRHCFAVTASLDSLVVGEPQVLGQVKTAHRLAREAGTLGNELDMVLQAAFAAAKRVRSETPVGEGPVSIAAAAVQLARDLHGDLGRCTGLLVGAADMGELVAESLLAAGLARLMVTAPRASRADALATSLNANVMGFDGLRDGLAEADVVVCSVGGRTLAVTADMVGAALRKRRRRPMFLVDAGIPGDIEPAVNRLDGAFVYDLGDLERVALEGRAVREQAARAAWTIVEDEVDAFLRGRAARIAVPAVVALRQRFEAVRDEVVAGGATDGAEMCRLLVNRLLHDPSEVMKSVAADGQDWRDMEKTLRKLFRLD